MLRYSAESIMDIVGATDRKVVPTHLYGIEYENLPPEISQEFILAQKEFTFTDDEKKNMVTSLLLILDHGIYKIMRNSLVGSGNTL